MNASTHTVSNELRIRKVGRSGLPAFVAETGGETVALLERQGWWRIFMGSGQRILLSDGSEWRLRAVGRGGVVCPVIVDRQGRKIALGSPVDGGYGVIGKDFAYKLYPTDRRRFGSAGLWVLWDHETAVAELSRFPDRMRPYRDVHLGAALISFVLIRHGALGENKMIAPRINWT